MNKSEQLNELAAALAKAQAVVEGAAKDTTNPHFNRKYADMASVWSAIRKPLTDNGLSITQWLRSVEGGVEVETMLLHTSGQFISDVFGVPVGKPDAQGYGSAATYARRYSLMAAIGIAPVDDDGNDATHGDGHKNFRPGPKATPADNGRSFGMGGKAAFDEAQRVSQEQAHAKPAHTNGEAGPAKTTPTKAAAWLSRNAATLAGIGSFDDYNKWLKATSDQRALLSEDFPDLADKLALAMDETRTRLPTYTQGA